jgi:DNA polymerase-3 subunit delta
MAKTAALSAFDLLLEATQLEPVPACALVGDEGFLKHEARRALVDRMAGPEGKDSVDILDGDAELRDVLDALSARSLFGSDHRIVVVEDADALVTECRAQLEDYVVKPFPDATLVLEVSTWPATTRLAKAVAATGLTISCQAPAKGAELTAFNKRLKTWLVAVAKRDHQCELMPAAVDLLLDLLPSEAGILYQEVARLALLGRGKIDAELVRQNVGGWRTRQTWDMIDAAADGRAADALMQLDRLIAAGDDAHGILPQMASTLRRFALAVRLFERAEKQRRPITLRGAVQQAGFLPFKLDDAERQLRQIGRPRARQLYRWLLAADLSIKDYNSPKPAARRVVEHLILRLSKEAQAQQNPARQTTGVGGPAGAARTAGGRR